MKQNDQKENRRDFLKNIGLGLFGISVLSNFSFENFLGSKALAKEFIKPLYKSKSFDT